MTISSVDQVAFGTELGPWKPDTSIEHTSAFAEAVGWGRAARFSDHAAARAEGHAGAMVPGIMGMGFLTTLIRTWAPEAAIEEIDTVFRAPMIADEPIEVSAVVTDIDEDEGVVELDLTIRNAAAETRLFGTARLRFS